MAFATDYYMEEVEDPLSGDPVRSAKILSSGSYIYQWDSKFDYVFWPYTDEAWITMNPRTGYAAFSEDFEQVSESEKAKLTEWLANHYDPENPPQQYKEKLLWLEKIYKQRDKDLGFWSRYYRLMAYTFRDEEDKSLEYVRKAIPLLEDQVLAAKDDEQTPYLFVLGEYHRRLGNESKAESYFRRVWRRQVSYFDLLLEERLGWEPRQPFIDMQAIWKRVSAHPRKVGFGSEESMPTVVSLLYVIPNLYIFSFFSIIGFAKAKKKLTGVGRWGWRMFVECIIGYAASWAIFYIPAALLSPQEFPWHLWFLLYVPFFGSFFFWIRNGVSPVTHD